MFNSWKKPDPVVEAPAPLRKFRIAYVAVNHTKIMRTNRESGVQEVLDDQISFRQEASPTVEAATVDEAVAQIKKGLPPNVEFTFQAYPIP